MLGINLGELIMKEFPVMPLMTLELLKILVLNRACPTSIVTFDLSPLLTKFQLIL